MPDDTAMKLYRLSGNNFDARYARAAIADDDEPPLECPACHRLLPREPETLRIAWLTGRDANPLNEIGDFTWPCGLRFIVVRDEVRKRMASKLPDAVFREVEIVGVREAGSAKPCSANNSPTMPSNGLPLWWLTSENMVHLDVDKSGRRRENCCTRCGRCDWIVADNAEVLVSTSELGGATVFCVQEVGAPYFVIEPIAEWLSQHRFSNLQIKPAGRVL